MQRQNRRAEEDGGPHALPDGTPAVSGRPLDLRRGLPLEHATMRAEDADETAHNRVGREQRLIGQQNDRQAELLARARRVMRSAV